MVNKLIKNSTALMFQRQTTILSAAGILMAMAIGGAALSLVKLHLLSGLFNDATKDALDAYTIAFLIPDFFFNILILGALNAAFIPVFGQLFHQKKERQSWDVLSSMINGSVIFFSLIAVFVLLTADYLVPLLAPKFDAEKLALTAHLTRLLMISPLLLGVSAFVTGAIQVHHRFLIPTIAPILYNVGAIVGILWLFPEFGVDGLAYGIILGSILHLAVQLPMIRHLGYRYRPRFDWRDKAVQRISTLTIPRSIGLSIDRLEIVVTSMLLATLTAGAPFLFSRIQNLIVFPISFFGVSIAQAALPTLTKETLEDMAAFRQTLLTTFHQILYLVVPATVLMVVLKLPITRMALNLGDWTYTLEAAQVLFWLAPAILAHSSIHLWARACYALEDSVSPLLAGSVGVVLTILVSILSLQAYGMRGVALGIVVGGFVSAGLLIYLVHRRIGGFGWSNFFVPMMRIAVCGAVMALAVYWPVKPMEAGLFDTSRTVDLIMLSMVVSGFGLSLYLFVSWVLGSKEIVMFIKVAYRLRSWHQTFVRFPASYSNTGVAHEVRANDPQTP